jgi:NAD+ synthase
MIPPILAYDTTRFVKETKKQIQDYLSKAGTTKVVIGASTGLDSTTTLYLTKEILGEQNILAVHLPHHDQEKSAKEFQSICDLVDIPQENRFIDDIRPMLDTYNKQGNTIQMTNFLTRVQRAVLFDYSHKYNAPVIGTLNRTEHELGEYPIFALAASIQPIQTLFKTQVRELAKYLGAPEFIQQRVPTIDTWLGKTDQIMRTKIVEIGIPTVDQILKCALDLKETPEEIANRGFKKEDVEFVLHMHEKNAFKKGLPYVPTMHK